MVHFRCSCASFVDASPGPDLSGGQSHSTDFHDVPYWPSSVLGVDAPVVGFVALVAVAESGRAYWAETSAITGYPPFVPLPSWH